MPTSSATLPASSDHRLSWAWQRFGWACGALILLAAAAGLLGGEPASRRTASSPDGGLKVEYDRLARSGKPADFIIIRPKAGPGPLTLDLHGVTPQRFRVLRLLPGPTRCEALDDGLRLVYEPPGPGPRVQVTVEPVGIGPARLEVRLPASPGEPAVPFRQFVYP